jgi:hypothetical protein
MAGEMQINTRAYPAVIPNASSGGTAGLVYGLVVANVAALTGALAASVPQYTIAIVLTTKQIFVTEDNVNWQAYS